MRRVAFQGALGAYSEEAVLRAFGPTVSPVPCRENRDVTRAVADGSVDAGVLPIENTLAGSVHVSYDAILAEPSIHAVREVILPIHHCILGLPGASIGALRVVESHAIALAQCTVYFGRHRQLEPRAVYDTAGAAAEVAASGDVTRGALASRIAATRHGLAILAENVEDRPDNQTRFLVLTREPLMPTRGDRVRTLLVVDVENRPGSLLRLLTPLAERELNLVKLESRPGPEPWTYRFILEFEHAFGDRAADEAVAAIQSRARHCRAVGTYTAEAGGQNGISGVDVNDAASLPV